MLRKQLIDLQEYTGAEPGFRWRGREVTRLEGFTDAAFAFAITLLIVSLEVPHTFAELVDVTKGFGAFLLTFAVLMLVWYQHFRFFRRYGLQDTTTVVLNAVLIFVVLFYVYPLKFLYGWIIDQATGAPATVRLPSGELAEVLPPAQAPLLMLMAGLGWLAGIVVFGLFYWRAYALRAQLDLSPFEAFVTREELQNWGLAGAVTLTTLASLLVVPAPAAVWTLAIYGLYFPLRAWHYWALSPRRKQLAAAGVEPPPTPQDAFPP
ncbi:MAG TPA: TMEM175 family protein [Chloroflexia bacterium]|nr:TMEM175 family protein [Chloroflexia bacterium]